MLSLHSHRERALNDKGDLISHHKTRVVISQLVVSEYGEVVEVGKVFKKRVSDGTRVARLVKSGSSGDIFLITSKGSHSSSKSSKCHMFKNRS